MQTPTVIKTIEVRVRDKHAPVPRRTAFETNTVWNVADEPSHRMITERGRRTTGHDFDPYVSGAGGEFEHVGSSTVQELCPQYAVERRAAKRAKLRWRKSFGDRRSLGSVPFEARAAVRRNGQVRFAGRHFRVRDGYGLSRYAFRAGCFAEDARGRWYFCAAVQAPVEPSMGQGAVGIDLGLKATATCSDGQVLEGRTYRKYEKKLAAAQRARCFKQVRALHAKVRNVRADELHEFPTTLVRRYGEIHVGNVSSARLVETRMAKGVDEAAWSGPKTMFGYESRQAGIVYREVREAYTARGCSECGALSGPQGLTGLSVGDRRCDGCGAHHDRDVNAARNIRQLGAGHRAP